MIKAIEKALRATVEKLRANKDAAEYGHLFLAVIFPLLLSMAAPATATPIVGKFTGVVNSGDGAYRGTPLADLVGQPLRGSFTYESAALRDPALGASYFPTSALTYTLQVGTHAFVVAGNYQSMIKEVDFGSMSYDIGQFLVSFAISYDAQTTEVNQFNIQLKHGGAGGFFADPTDLSSLGFSTNEQFPLLEGNGGIIFDLFGERAGIGFTIDTADAGAAEVPEPAIALLICAALCMLALARTARRSRTRLLQKDTASAERD